MAKTRMNSGHRGVLKEFAESKIDEVVDRKIESKLYNKLVSTTNVAIRKKYPEKDMEILRKYQLTKVDNCLRFLFPSGRVDGFTFNGHNSWGGADEGPSEIVDMPYTRGCFRTDDVFPMNEAFEEILGEHSKIKEENDKLKNQKRRDCNSLIDYAKYIEDVLEVIKVPKNIEEKLLAKSTALVALSPDVIERIQADFSA